MGESISVLKKEWIFPFQILRLSVQKQIRTHSKIRPGKNNYQEKKKTENLKKLSYIMEEDNKKCIILKNVLSVLK